jgi:serine/threonine-protein kinase
VLRRLLRQGTASAEDSEERGLLPGTVLANRYRVVNLLGHGGMGMVYRADDLKLGQAVALKFLPEQLQREQASLQLFLDEVKLARQIAHPNVCRVYDVTEADGRHFLSMEYIDGEDLASLLRRIGHLPKEKSLDIARQLCAGLAAAHEAGILHRDLKPANVMLDGRGRVRITDFGLAVAADSSRQSQAGTPAYMAPEQLEGRVATSRSDLYALGLVLYELFTGKRAFALSTPEEARRLRDESTPTRPSALVEGFDPGVERIILRCLERDPALRPPTARAVAAALPGGDPLAAAVAAGETPSPELVAAAGPEGALKPAVAFGTLGATLAMLILLVLLADRTSILGWVPWTRSADALEDSARAMLERLGHGGEPGDRARMIWFGSGRYLRYVEANDSSPGRWNPLRDRGQRIGVFFYRQASRYLAPVGRDGRVTSEDPASAPGDIAVFTDLRGRLSYLEVEPEEAERPRGDVTTPDWAPLFREAGLDAAHFREVPPTRNPPVFADIRAAWTGVLSDFGGYTVRVEAAARGGKPVFFELVFPWDSYWDPAAPKLPPRPPTPARIVYLLVPVILIGGIVLGGRNWLRGRGDRRGAFRLAAVVFFLRFGVWIFGGHHVPAPEEEGILLIIALSKSLIDAAVIWCLYMALEPLARRVHPRFLISWTRLLRGRFADPLVGRDVLGGVALGTLYILFYLQLHVLIPHVLGLRAPPPPLGHPGGRMPFMYFLDPPVPQAALGGRYVLESLLARPLGALGMLMVVTILLLGLKLVLRKDSAVLLAFAAIAAIGAPPVTLSHFSAIGIACGIVIGVILVAALRFGLLGTLALLACQNVWLNFPVTAKLNAPHFGIGLVGVLAIAALAAYGAFTASRPRRMVKSAEARLAA